MKNFPLWLVGASLALPILATAQANQVTTPRLPGEPPGDATLQRAVASVRAASSAAGALPYQSSLAGYARTASPTTSADKAWLPANQFVREVDQMSMGSGNSSPAAAHGASSAAPPSASASTSALTKPAAEHAQHSMQGMSH
jgi:hypothetical protein